MKDRRKEGQTYVLVVKEKHGEYYYDATGDKLYDVAWTLFNERLDERWYPDETWIKDPGPEEITVEEIEALKPNPTLYKMAVEDRQKWVRKVKANKQIQEQLDEIARIKSTEDKRAAWEFIYYRSDYEYEGVELEALL